MSTLWPVMPLKRNLILNDGGVWGNDPSGVSGTPVLRSTDQSVDGAWKISEPAFRELSGAERSRFLLKCGDIVVTKSSGSPSHIGKSTLVDTQVASMGACYSNFMQRLRCGRGLQSKFLWYVLRSHFVRDQIALLATTSTGLANLTGTVIGNLAIPTPSLADQSRATEFLDRETAEIDAFIADQEKLIGLLAERRAATISHAVTKGLDPTVPMKDSGVEWLGGEETPSHWDAIKLGRVALFRSGETITAESIEASGTYPVFGGGGFRGYTERFTNDGCHALVGRQGALCGNVRLADGRFFASEHALVSYPRRTLDTRWLVWMLEVMDLGQYSQSAAQPGIAAEVIMQKKTLVPPFADQQTIADFLEQATTEMDSAIADAKEAIALSRERRAALISAAVTGKIDVREQGAVA